MRYGIECSLIALAVWVCSFVSASAGELREAALREHATQNGLVPAASVNLPFDANRAKVGEALFRSTLLSLNGDTSCHSCHLEQFGSTDGLPNAVGVRGVGEGPMRLQSDGQIVPRNTLPLWGRGGKEFDILFWDGKVQKVKGKVISQFGDYVPSQDPLVVAVHLPVVEIREMIDDSPETDRQLKKEDVNIAFSILDSVAKRVSQDEELGPMLSSAYGVNLNEIAFSHIADSIAHFIRSTFRVRQSRFERFVFDDGTLTDDELRGGILCYGKGKCAACHNGPYFSDLKPHALAVPQAGFGKNGFGVDYGRFNVTFDPEDLYKVRTPPLLNVALTGPYTHSGAISNLNQTVVAHFDPLVAARVNEMGGSQRLQFYERLKAWSSSYPQQAGLRPDEVSKIVEFLKTLSYCKPSPNPEEEFCTPID